jgi:uncharacterized protein YkwD
MLILVILAAWLFMVVLAMALLRSAALADRAHAERNRHEAHQAMAAEQRGRTAALLLVVAVPLIGAAAPVATAQGADTRCSGAEVAPDPAREREALQAALCLINAERRDRALVPLDLDARLAVAAQRHSADMVARAYFSHVSPGGGTLVDRLRRADYAGRCAWRAGETLAWGSGTMRTPASRVRAWMDSPRHREVLLDAAYRDVGIGIVKGLPGRTGDGFTYTSEFGRRWC